MAISYSKAYKLVQENDYFIIYEKRGIFDDASTTYYYDGENRGPVILVGMDPTNLHGGNGNAAIFCSAAKNKFLVKGEKLETYQDIVEKTVIYVEDWDIIAPVKRKYADEYTHRYIYPITCIDEYDVEKGDYIPDIISSQALYSWEVDYYLNNEKDYYLVTPKREGNIVYWYLCSDGISDIREELTQQVELEGNIPKEEQYGNILDEETVDDLHFRNFILVKGKYENNTIQVEKWELADDIYRKAPEEKGWHSAYFLDARDLEKQENIE